MLDVTRFSKCLFAYLYRKYDSIPSIDLPGGLPASLFLRIPSHFVRSLGDCIIAVNKLLRPSLWTLFDKGFVDERCNETTFYNFAYRLCDILPTEHLESLFLTMCAVVSELNLYFFHKNCFRFANYAPLCLASVLKCSNKLVGTIVYDMDTFCVFRNDGLDGYQTLIEYGNTFLQEVSLNPQYVPETVQEMSRLLLAIHVDPIDYGSDCFEPQPLNLKIKADPGPSTSGACMSSGATSSKICRICQHSNCVKFLDDFEFDFRTVY